jgi:hypothetical protein
LPPGKRYHKGSVTRSNVVFLLYRGLHFIDMSKDTFYFSHDYEPTSDPKIQALLGEHGAIGYGIYWRIIEMLHSDCNHKLPFKKYLFLAIAKQMLASAEQIEAIIQQSINVYELFDSDAEYFWSKRVLRNFERRAELSEKRSVAGKAGAIAKQNLANTSKGKKRKEKKEENNIKEFDPFWDSYHSITGLNKSDKEAALKYWRKLKPDEQQKAIENINFYFDSLNDKKYCKKARTYLADKNFNDEFKNIPKLIDRNNDPRYGEGLVENPNFIEEETIRMYDRK